MPLRHRPRSFARWRCQPLFWHQEAITSSLGIFSAAMAGCPAPAKAPAPSVARAFEKTRVDCSSLECSPSVSADYVVVRTSTVAIGSSACGGSSTCRPSPCFITFKGVRTLSANKYAPAYVAGYIVQVESGARPLEQMDCRYLVRGPSSIATSSWAQNFGPAVFVLFLRGRGRPPPSGAEREGGLGRVNRLAVHRQPLAHILQPLDFRGRYFARRHRPDVQQVVAALAGNIDQVSQ